MPMDMLGPETGLLLAARDWAARDEEYADEPAASRAPAMAPGQAWVIEMDRGRPPSPHAQALIAAADIVIYDSLLAESIAAIRPPGRYSEPAPAAAAGPPVAERCVRFARDGWLVVRAVIGNADAVASGLLAAGSRRIGTWDTRAEGGPMVAVFAAPAVGPAAAAVVANGLAG
jgi:hypothetical protein